MKLQLKNYQKRTIEFCKSTDKVILAISMGLGKTAAVLHYIDYAKPKTLLIVAPKFVALNVWKQEAEKWIEENRIKQNEIRELGYAKSELEKINPILF